MAPTVLAARRRAARSTKAFRLILASFLVFCVLVSWSSNLFHFRGEILYPAFDGSRRAFSEGNMITNDEQEDQRFPPGPALSLGKILHGDYMPLRIITFNIRYANSRPVAGEQLWEVRGPKLCNQINFITVGHESPFLCLQEALFSQVKDVQSYLGTSWSYVGGGRDDGKTQGEFSPIFYRSDVWKCEHTETRWLSKTPERPSRGWDAALPRIVTMGNFSHKVTGTKVVVMSTHFDHRGPEARMNSAKLLIQFAQEWSSAGNASAVLIGGDFNSPPDDGAYKIMTAPGSGMSDMSDLVPVDKHYGNRLTYTSFGEPNESPQRIDFLFIQEPHTALVRTFGVLANSFDDQIRVSDHRAVVADMDIAV